MRNAQRNLRGCVLRFHSPGCCASVTNKNEDPCAKGHDAAWQEISWERKGDDMWVKVEYYCLRCQKVLMRSTEIRPIREK